MNLIETHPHPADPKIPENWARVIRFIELTRQLVLSDPDQPEPEPPSSRQEQLPPNPQA